MGRITALKVQKRNSNRVNVFIDEEFAFGLYRISAAWLRVGQELSDEKIAQLLTNDANEGAFHQALRLLEYRPRTEEEIRKNLRKHGVEDPIIESVLERLRRGELVNDQQFAKAWIENRSEFRPRSRRALTYEMRQRGVSNEAIQSALLEIDVDEDELAYQAARKYARKLSDLEWIAFRQKLAGFLSRRGFNYSVIQPTVQRTWNEMHEDIEP
jgi:regulatory protein